MIDFEKVVKGLECCLEHEDCNPWTYCANPCEHGVLNGGDRKCFLGLLEDALDLIWEQQEKLKAREPRVLTLEEVKNRKICWIEDDEAGVTYPAIYQAIGNRSAKGQYAVFTINPDMDILPDDSEDDEVRYQFDDGSRWLWEGNIGKTWRCWSARPTDEQRKAVKWDD